MANKIDRYKRVLLDRMQKGNWDANGSAAYFIKLNKIGIKVYRFKHNRNFAFKTQTKAAEYGYGPKTYQSFDVSDGENTFYAYVTEVANVETVQTNWWQWVEEDAMDLDVKLNNIGIPVADNHKDNYGLIGDRLVCIDFGKESM